MEKVESVVREQNEVTRKFSEQLKSLVNQQDFILLAKRVEAGIQYFAKVINEEILPPLQEYNSSLGKQKRVKKVRRKLNELINLLSGLKKVFDRASSLARDFK
jgi:hypothetical protein